MIFSGILVSRVEAPVVALVTGLTAEGASAWCTAARGGRDRRQVQQGHVQLAGRLADLCVRVRVRVRVAVHEEDPRNGARRGLLKKFLVTKINDDIFGRKR